MPTVATTTNPVRLQPVQASGRFLNHKILRPSEEHVKLCQTPEYLNTLPVFNDTLPHSNSGKLHSYELNNTHRLYFHRHYRKKDQPARNFVWSFFIAKHSGSAHIADVATLREFVIPYNKWRENNIICDIRGRSGKWAQCDVSVTLEESRIRLFLGHGSDEEESFDLVFPPNPDFPEPCHTLEYTGEDSDDSD